MITIFEAVSLAVVEGVTEYLPVSSTGHLIIARDLMGLDNDDFTNAFLVIIQGGAILAVISAYFKTFVSWFNSWRSYFKHAQIHREDVVNRTQSLYVFFSLIPFATVGFFLKDYIKELFSVGVVAAALIVGGILILILEALLQKKHNKQRSDSVLTFLDFLAISCGQCLAMWPGFSRSAATILSARLRGYDRPAAAQLSFLVGLPALSAVSLYEMLKVLPSLNASHAIPLIVGVLCSWLVAYICVKGFVAFLKKYSLSVFALYRIGAGVFLIWYFRLL